jgi:hypothetical protein
MSVIKPASVLNRSASADELIRANATPVQVAIESQPGDPEAPQGFEAPAPQSEVVQLPTSFGQHQQDEQQDDQQDEQQDDEPEAPNAGNGHDSYEHRFRVLQGKYTAETKRLREQAADTKEQLDQMRALMGLMQEQLASRAAPAPAAPTPEPATPEPAIAPLSDREIEDHGGKELFDAMARYVLGQLAPRLGKIEREVSNATGRVGEAVSAATAVQKQVKLSAREQMFAKLSAEVSDWRTLNNDDHFKAWLAEEDELSGETRQALLLRAYERNDAPRVLRFFQNYKAEHATGDEPAVASRPAPARNTASVAANPAPAVDPSTLVAPGRGRSAPRNGAQQQIVWTPADIARFYNDVRIGAYKSKPDEAERLEKDIFRAQSEGRIQA